MSIGVRTLLNRLTWGLLPCLPEGRPVCQHRLAPHTFQGRVLGSIRLCENKTVVIPEKRRFAML